MILGKNPGKLSESRCEQMQLGHRVLFHAPMLDGFLSFWAPHGRTWSKFRLEKADYVAILTGPGAMLHTLVKVQIGEFAYRPSRNFKIDRSCAHSIPNRPSCEARTA